MHKIMCVIISYLGKTLIFMPFRNILTVIYLLLLYLFHSFSVIRGSSTYSLIRKNPYMWFSTTCRMAKFGTSRSFPVEVSGYFMFTIMSSVKRDYVFFPIYP